MAIFEELQEAINQAYMLGLKLNLPSHEVDAIRKIYPDPREFLLQVILAFLRRAKPRPTWRVIVDALRSPIVNLTALAERVEAARLSSSGQVSAADSSVVEQCYTSEVYFGKRSLKNEVIDSSSFIVTLADSPLHSVD